MKPVVWLISLQLAIGHYEPSFEKTPSFFLSQATYFESLSFFSLVLHASNVDGHRLVLLGGRAIDQCGGADLDEHAGHQFQACMAKCFECIEQLKGFFMLIFNLLPDQDVPSGPKEPSESRNAARKKERSNPRFA